MKKCIFFTVLLGTFLLSSSLVFSQTNENDHFDELIASVDPTKNNNQALDMSIESLEVAPWYIYPNWTMGLGVSFGRSFAIIPGHDVEIFIATSSGSGNFKISCNEFDFPNGDVVVTVPANSTHTIKFKAPSGESNMTLAVTKGLNLPATVSVKYKQ